VRHLEQLPPSLLTTTDRFPKLIINGQTDAAEWTNVRQTRNYQTNQGVTDVNSADMRCYQMKAGSGTATIAAGDTLGFAAAASISHFGPVQLYMARVPDSANINTWEASGNVWFKAGSIDAVKPASGTFTSDETTWPAYSMSLLFSSSVLCSSLHMLIAFNNRKDIGRIQNSCFASSRILPRAG
jgi:hypothetical protein